MLEYSFIFGNAAIIERKNSSASSLPDPSKSIYLVTDLLTELFETLLAHQTCDSILQQCYHQILYYISAFLFNILFKKKQYCNTKTGFRIKMGLSFIESWTIQINSKHNNILDECLFASFSFYSIFIIILYNYLIYSLLSVISFIDREKQQRYHLDYITEAANILTLATNEHIFNSVEVISQSFPSLTAHQISALINSFTPDNLSPQNVPDKVKQIVRRMCLDSKDDKEIFFPKTISLNELKVQYEDEGEGEAEGGSDDSSSSSSDEDDNSTSSSSSSSDSDEEDDINIPIQEDIANLLHF